MFLLWKRNWYMQRKISPKVILYLKGMAMGIADIIPGVSGGTIALISGIYEELLFSIRSINTTALKLLYNRKSISFFKHINGNFLLILFLGIITSILLFSRIVLFFLKTYPELLWAFFFGLIVASIFSISKKIRYWSILTFMLLITGIASAWFILSIQYAITGSDHILYIFLCGFIAIVAMILPGISGSFILILLGAYEKVIFTLNELINKSTQFEWIHMWKHFQLIFSFVLGCLVGLVSFSHLLSWLLRKYYNYIIALLTGFMTGSLYKVWPWKQTLTTYTDRHGVVKPLAQINIWPFEYTTLTGNRNFFIEAIAAAAIGFLLVYGLEKMQAKRQAD